MPGPRRRRKGKSDQAAATTIGQGCRSLRLPTVRALAEDVVTIAEHHRLAYRGLRTGLLLG